MRVAFFSNFMNNHQLPLCLELEKRLGSDFIFVSTAGFLGGQVTSGWSEMDSKYPFVFPSYCSEENRQYAQSLMDESEIVILGDNRVFSPNTRLRNKKMTFRYSERIYKPNYPFVGCFLSWTGELRNAIRWRSAPYYLLCASAFAARDYAMSGAFIRRAYRWGYFPRVEKEPFVERENSQTLRLLWVGRFLDWKHGEDAINATAVLLQNGVQVQLTMIGDGPMLDEWKQSVSEQNLQDRIQFTGGLPPEQVTSYFLETDVFLATSDFNEGWGAVVNEAMSYGCACVVSREMGCAPYLIHHGENGYLYKRGDIQGLSSLISRLQSDGALRAHLGRSAYNMIENEWSGEIAAERFLALASALGNGSDTPFLSGPCSIAPIQNGEGGKNEYH